MSAVIVPADLVLKMEQRGAPGREWLDRLPDRVRELSRRWHLDPGEPFAGGAGASWVAPAGELDGMAVVLKVGWPHREARTEAAGLRFFDARGAVRLVDADEEGFALVEERCRPGDDLWVLPVEEGNAVAAEVLARLWRPPNGAEGIEALADIVGEWIEEFRTDRTDYPPDLLRLAAEVARELVSTQADPVVLHGDFNPGNVLAADRDGWLSIDCKPLVGERAYDLAQFVANRLGVFDPVTPTPEIARQIAFFAGELGLDFDRIARWAFVKSLGWRWGGATAKVLAEVAGLVEVS